VPQESELLVDAELKERVALPVCRSDDVRCKSCGVVSGRRRRDPALEAGGCHVVVVVGLTMFWQVHSLCCLVTVPHRVAAVKPHGVPPKSKVTRSVAGRGLPFLKYRGRCNSVVLLAEHDVSLGESTTAAGSSGYVLAVLS
jgi:hypothetical protein